MVDSRRLECTGIMNLPMSWRAFLGALSPVILFFYADEVIESRQSPLSANRRALLEGPVLAETTS